MAKKKNQNDDEPNDESLNKDSDDAFGLPEINYEPLKKESDQPAEEPAPNEEIKHETYQEPTTQMTTESETPGEEESYSYKPYEEESSVWPKILGIVFVIVLALGATWYFLYYQPQQKKAAEKAKQEEEQKAAAEKQRLEEERARLAREAAEKRRQDSLAAIQKSATGVIETLSGRTGRYYVVIASAIDQDLLMDYAKKLSAKGVSSKIIPPFGKHKVSRITIAEGESWTAAQAKADELKAEYGSAVWVLKY